MREEEKGVVGCRGLIHQIHTFRGTRMREEEKGLLIVGA
jgi:hypothetical protein